MAGEIRANSVVHQLHPLSVSLGKTCQGGFQPHIRNTCLGSAAKRKTQCPSALLPCCTKGTSSACESIFSYDYCLYKELRDLPHISIRFKLQRILFRTTQTFHLASTAAQATRAWARWGRNAGRWHQEDQEPTRTSYGLGGSSRRSPAASPAFAGARLAPGGRGGHRTLRCCAGLPGMLRPLFFPTSGKSPGRVWLD